MEEMVAMLIHPNARVEIVGTREPGVAPTGASPGGRR